MRVRGRTLGGMTSQPFGAGPPFLPTHSADQVVDALRGHMPADELTEIARQLRKAVKRRNRSRKDSTDLSNLLALVHRASQPPALTGPVEVFDRPTGGEPLEVVLMGGPNVGDRVTLVPPGVGFVVPTHTSEPLYVRPSGSGGPDGLVLEGAGGALAKISPEPDGGYVAQMSTPTC